MTLCKREMLAELQRQIEVAGGVMLWSRKTGISPTVVSLVKTQARAIPDTVANACGFIVEKTYRKL